MNLFSEYRKLPKPFFDENLPSKVENPHLLLWNSELANELEIPLSWDHSLLAKYFSGNKRLDKSTPISTAYAGHQFGNFVPQLLKKSKPILT